MIRRAALAALVAAAPAALAAGEFFTLEGHGGPIMGIAVAPETGRIATASFDNSVGLWQGTAPRWLEDHRAAVNRVLFTGDGALLSGGDDFRVVEWDIATGTARELAAHKGKVMGLALAPDGRRVASGSWDGSIGLTDRASGETRFLTGHDSGVNAVAFSGDGTGLYSTSSDGTLRLWDVASGSERRQILSHGFGINTLVVNEAEGWLAYGAVDGGTRVIALADGAQIADFTLDRRPILAMAYSPVTDLLAVGDGEGYIMVVDTAEWRIARDFRATQQGPVWALAMSPDGTSIHAGGLDDILYSWPVDTLTEHGRMADGGQSFLRPPEEMGNGERQFARKCSICHTLTPGSQRRAGPTLHGLFGRQAGTVADYSYSETLDGSDIVWTDETIDALFDLGPDHYIPGSKMPMQRIVAPEDRQDLIEYLRVATRGGGELE